MLNTGSKLKLEYKESNYVIISAAKTAKFSSKLGRGSLGGAATCCETVG